LHENHGLHDSVEVTTVRSEFLDGIYEIECQSFIDPYPFQVFVVLAGRTPETFLVAVSANVVVGYVLASLDEDIGHILSIAVRLDFRGRGLGSRMMIEMLETLRRKGTRFTELEVRISNRKAVEFYKKFGFKVVGHVKRYYRDGEDAVRMTRKVSQ